jgi:hypothetical protein
MKLIKITPEWILTELPKKQIKFDNDVCIYKVAALDACWYNLALTTLDIDFKQNEITSDEMYICAVFEFRIEDIRRACPSLYEKLQSINESNRIKEEALINMNISRN